MRSGRSRTGQDRARRPRVPKGAVLCSTSAHLPFLPRTVSHLPPLWKTFSSSPESVFSFSSKALPLHFSSLGSPSSSSALPSSSLFHSRLSRSLHPPPPRGVHSQLQSSLPGKAQPRPLPERSPPPRPPFPLAVAAAAGAGVWAAAGSFIPAPPTPTPPPAGRPGPRLGQGGGGGGGAGALAPGPAERAKLWRLRPLREEGGAGRAGAGRPTRTEPFPGPASGARTSTGGSERPPRSPVVCKQLKPFQEDKRNQVSRPYLHHRKKLDSLLHHLACFQTNP